MSLTITPAEIVAKAEASGAPGLLAKAKHWDRVPLGEVATVVNGAAFPSPGFNLDGRGMPLIRIRDVGAKSSTTWFEGPWEHKHLVKHGDILIGMDGDFRVARWQGDDALLNQRVCRIDVNEDRYLGSFLVLVLQGYLDAIWSETSSVTVKHLSSRSVAAIPLPAPPIEEQRRIVDLLEDHLSRLDAAARGLSVGLRRSESLLTSGLWQSTHGLPGAVRVELQSIAEVRLGRQRSPKNHSGDRMRPYLRAANVDWGRLRLDDVKEMQFTEAEEQTYRLREGDILLTEASGSPAEVGKSVTYRGIPADVCFQNTLLRVRCHSADPDFVQAYLLAEARAGRFMPASRGVGINHLGRARLAALPLELPPTDVQSAAVARCRELNEAVTRLKITLDRQADRTSALRRSLLAAAFSGRLTGNASDLSEAEEMIGA